MSLGLIPGCTGQWRQESWEARVERQCALKAGHCCGPLGLHPAGPPRETSPGLSRRGEKAGISCESCSSGVSPGPSDDSDVSQAKHIPWPATSSAKRRKSVVGICSGTFHHSSHIPSGYRRSACCPHFRDKQTETGK